jgi:hypothetical protein
MHQQDNDEVAIFKNFDSDGTVTQRKDPAPGKELADVLRCPTLLVQSWKSDIIFSETREY